MALSFNPTKVRLLACNINGADVRLLVHNITVYESMCKPYIKATLTLVDNNNVINELKLRGAEPVRFSFDGGTGRVYSSLQYILTIDGEESSESNRAIIYTITTATVAFFRDRSQLVQKSHIYVPGSAAAAQIHSEYIKTPLDFTQSMGMIAKRESGGYVTGNKKPFTAIDDILKQIAYGGFPTGSPVYFENVYSHVMKPLELIFATMGSQNTFEQRATWGSQWQHTFTTTHVVIAAKTVINEDKVSGRGGAGNIAKAATSALNIFDISEGVPVMTSMGSGAPGNFLGAGASTGSFGGKGGGIRNVLNTDSRRRPLSTDQGINSAAQNMFQAQVKDTVNYIIKVPIQSGIYCTVGKGITAKLIAPSGDQPGGRNSVGGKLLVADLSHVCYFDNRTVQATTTMRGVQGYQS